MHFQTSGYLPALRDLILPTDSRIAWGSMRNAGLSQRDEAKIARRAKKMSAAEFA
jgi:hypothetical protein